MKSNPTMQNTIRKIRWIKRDQSNLDSRVAHVCFRAREARARRQFGTILQTFEVVGGQLAESSKTNNSLIIQYPEIYDEGCHGQGSHRVLQALPLPRNLCSMREHLQRLKRIEDQPYRGGRILP
jgi:hypothetical protein